MNMRDKLMSDIDEFILDPEVSEKVKEFIDEVERKVNSIRDNLDVKSLQDLCKLEDAKSEIDDLSTELY